ncbi:hypothetical protein [Shewanella sp. SM20]|nr:hypothetical protein [Shewanella sp. SM20]
MNLLIELDNLALQKDGSGATPFDCHPQTTASGGGDCSLRL